MVDADGVNITAKIMDCTFLRADVARITAPGQTTG
jgi:hypothetical protein